MRILSKLILFCLLTLSVKAQPAFPTNVLVARLTNNVITLAWDRAASHTNIECFKLYVGIASGIYNTNYTTTNTTISISNLVGYVFYFTVTAKGSNGLESDYSNQISFDARRPEPRPHQARPRTAPQCHRGRRPALALLARPPFERLEIPTAASARPALPAGLLLRED